jgi:hypothetical protein
VHFPLLPRIRTHTHTHTRTPTRRHCIELLGEAVFARVYDLYASHACEADDAEVVASRLDQLLGADAGLAQFCPLVHELVSLESHHSTPTSSSSPTRS